MTVDDGRHAIHGVGVSHDMIQQLNDQYVLVGWREWVALPELGIARIKAKIDTGARTSALHAFQVDSYRERGKDKVRFSIHPLQRSKKVVTCTADLIDTRFVTDSGGHREKRYVIRTILVLGSHRQEIEITLTNRDDMRFRMLLGRTMLQRQFWVAPADSFLHGRRPLKIK